MHVVYANQTPPDSWTSAIFLAGPTPRAETTAPSWRPEALKILEMFNYDGVVFVPEDENGVWLHSYDQQIEWEEMCLNYADVIIFWIPRELEQMPGFTTNDEWGAWKKQDPRKLILGTPPEAQKVRYQQYYAEKEHIPVVHSLQSVCVGALEKIFSSIVSPAKLRLRYHGERCVPLHIWNEVSFQRWYRNLVTAGNRLDSAKVEWVFRVGKQKQVVLYWILHVNIFIQAEGRNKTNEVVIGCPDISTIMLYQRREPVEDSLIVMVKEFRSPVSNEEGYVYELPGGSSWKPDKTPAEIAVDECGEEVGLTITKDRLRPHQTRQIAATTLTYRAYLFSAELTEAEMSEIKRTISTVRGVVTESEQTQSVVMTYGYLLTSPYVDWSMLGMIANVLQQE